VRGATNTPVFLLLRYSSERGDIEGGPGPNVPASNLVGRGRETPQRDPILDMAACVVCKHIERPNKDAAPQEDVGFLGMLRRLKAPHGAFSLPGGSMRILYPVIEALVLAVLNLHLKLIKMGRHSS
jgi:hypothetical protein